MSLKSAGDTQRTEFFYPRSVLFRFPWQLAIEIFSTNPELNWKQTFVNKSCNLIFVYTKFWCREMTWDALIWYQDFLKERYYLCFWKKRVNSSLQRYDRLLFGHNSSVLNNKYVVLCSRAILIQLSRMPSIISTEGREEIWLTFPFYFIDLSTL